MNTKLIPFLSIFLILLVGLVGADLTLNPTSVDFGSVTQGVTSNIKTTTIKNTDNLNPVTVTLTENDFTQTNTYIGDQFFQVSNVFDLETFVLNESGVNGDSKDITMVIEVPYETNMGEYTSTFTATYNGTETKTFGAKVLVSQYIGNVGLSIDSSSWGEIKEQSKKDSTYSFEIDVKNIGSTSQPTVRVDAWLYDSTIKKIVGYDSSDITSINNGQTEKFYLDLNIDNSLNEDDSFTLYTKAYETTDEEHYHAVKSKTFDILGGGDLCEIGDLDINNFEIDETDYSQGDISIIDVEVENNGNDKIKDVIVKVWLTESGQTKILEDEKSDQFDIKDGDTEDFQFELKLNDDLDDGDYEIHVKVYEKGNEDEQCIEEMEDINIERPDNKVIIQDVLINPIALTCGDSFTAELDVKNVGGKDDDAVKVRMYNSQLGIDVYSDTFSLDKYDDSGDDETIFLTAEIPEGSENKEHTLTLTLYYDDLDEQKNYVERITIGACTTSNVDDTVYEEDELEEDSTSGNSDTVYLTTGAAVTDWVQSDTAKTIFWIIADIALIIVAIYFFVAIVKKRKK